MNEKKEDVLRYIYAVSGKNRMLILLMLIVEIANGVIHVSYALFFKAVIDHAVGHDMDALLKSVISLLVLLALQISLFAVLRHFREYTASGLENAFKTRLFSYLLSGDYGQVSAVHSGDWMNRLTSDTKVIADSLSGILPQLAGLLTRMSGAAIMLIVIDLRFGMILISGGLVIAVLSGIFRKKLKELHKRVQEADGRLRMFLQEHLESLVIIKAYAVERKSISEAEDRMTAHRKVRMQKNVFSNICNTGFIAAMEGVYLFGFFYGAFGIYQGDLTYGTLIAMLQLIGQIRTPFAYISGYLPKYYAMIASAERIMEAEKISGSDRIVDAGGGGNNKISYTGEKPKEIKEFGFTDVSFSYFSKEKGETEVLSHLDLNIKQGEFVAFTGASGCGKTTALKLFLGLYPVKEGFLYVDAGEGRKEPDRELKQLFAYVPQGNLLMSGSIRDVVSYAAEDDHNIENALAIACASEFVSELPSGVDTILGERGSGLSEGQMQRIAIARAVCSDRPVLLLDEATSALDVETEKRLLMNLRSMTDKTVVIVTHRKAALSVCDREIHFAGI